MTKEGRLPAARAAAKRAEGKAGREAEAEGEEDQEPDWTKRVGYTPPPSQKELRRREKEKERERKWGDSQPGTKKITFKSREK
jgi:hypothetical protein